MKETNTQLQLDYNDYYSFDGSIGVYNGRLYSNLQTWSDSVGTDQNSLSVKPFYVSDTDLAMNQILLNNAGIPITGINTDIDGTSRMRQMRIIGARVQSM